MGDILNNTFWGNTVIAYLIAAGSILIAWIVLKIVKYKVIAALKRKAESTATQTDNILIKTVDDYVLPWGYLWVNFIIINQLALHAKFERVLSAAMLVITTYYLVRLINHLIHGLLIIFMERKNEPQDRIQQLNGILMVVKVIVWVLGIITLIDNLGYNVRTIIAGLGVGGIAIALAAQNILGDLFSYLVIFFDKPFEVGDFIIIGTNAGIVEKIGIKTSHVRSLDGQQMVMPNAEMVKSVIHNYKRLQRRRMVFSVSVSYLTPTAILKEIPGIIKHIIDQFEIVTFDRAHLKTFSEHSISYEIVYYINSAEFPVFMGAHQSVSIGILEAFEKRGIRRALPTTIIKHAGAQNDPFAEPAATAPTLQ